MFLALNPWQQRQTAPTDPRDDIAENVFEDRPSMDRQSQSYGAWQATAIFELRPFSAPPGR